MARSPMEGAVACRSDSRVAMATTGVGAAAPAPGASIWVRIVVYCWLGDRLGQVRPRHEAQARRDALVHPGLEINETRVRPQEARLVVDPAWIGTVENHVLRAKHQVLTLNGLQPGSTVICHLECL